MYFFQSIEPCICPGFGARGERKWALWLFSNLYLSQPISVIFDTNDLPFWEWFLPYWRPFMSSYMPIQHFLKPFFTSTILLSDYILLVQYFSNYLRSGEDVSLCQVMFPPFLGNVRLVLFHLKYIGLGFQSWKTGSRLRGAGQAYQFPVSPWLHRGWGVSYGEQDN